jgi:hypothetical protein
MKADWLLRNRGMREYQSYIDSYREPEVETNLPKIQIFNDCKLLINAIKSCVYDKTHPQDVAEFPGDDPYDGIRYLVDEADRYFNLASSEHKALQDRQHITDQLLSTGDMTAFYKNARKLENKQIVAPIRRYHRASAIH